MEHWFEDSDGALVSEISTLEANGKMHGEIVLLEGQAGFNLRYANIIWQVYHDGERDIAGWRFTQNGQKYLIIND